MLHNPLWAVAMENMTVLFDETVVLSTSKSVLKSSGESVGVHWSGYKGKCFTSGY